jgi:hypothetical protein
MTDMAPGTDANSKSLTDTLVGQAAAGITVAAAIIYGAGALTVALRLYFTHLPWASIIGQIPHDLIITTGFGQVVLPAAIVGLLGAILLNFLVNQDHPREPRRRKPGQTRQTVAGFLHDKLSDYLQDGPGLAHFGWWLGVSVVLGAAEAGIALPDYSYHRNGYLHRTVVISPLRFFLIMAGFSAVAVGIALIMLPGPRRRAGSGPGESKKESKLSALQWQAFVGACLAVAVIPGAAAISASTLFPYALACSPAFRNGQLSGNLIATNGGWAYLVDYHQKDYSQDYFSLIPLSSVRLMTIGKYGNIGCNTLAPARAPTPAATP